MAVVPLEAIAMLVPAEVASGSDRSQYRVKAWIGCICQNTTAVSRAESTAVAGLCRG